jgi:hypothetical protein
VVATWLLLVVGCVGLAGCGSIYHDARAKLPVKPAQELELRLKEGRRAEEAVRQAGGRLLGSLEQGRGGEVVAADGDRLAVAVVDLERRTLAAADAWRRCGEPAEKAQELRGLERRAGAWRAYVEAYGKGQGAAAGSELRVLVEGDVGGR